LSKQSLTVLSSSNSLSKQSILFCGDFCPINRASDLLQKERPNALLGDFKSIISDAGISIANLEAPFLKENSVPISKAGPSISISPDIATGIGALGFTAFGMANNHILDYGDNSLLNSQRILEKQGIQTFGSGANSLSASHPFTFVLEQNKYAVIGAADHEFSSSGKNYAGAYCPTDGELILQIIDLCKKYDHVIIYYHGGNEYNRYPSPGLVARCHLFVQAGASAVICHHSHVPGAIEFYKGVPIVYSLGNFVFDRGLKRPNDWYMGYAVALTLAEDNKFNLSVIPYNQFNSIPSITLFPKAESEDLLRFLNYQQTIIADAKLLALEWTIWCEKNRQEYIGRLFGMNRFIKKIYKILKYPLLRLSLQKKLYIYNLINCSAHREILLTLLSNKEQGEQQ